MSAFIRSKKQFPCSVCGVKVYIYYVKNKQGEPTSFAQWDIHENDDGRCKKSSKKVLNPTYIKEGK